MRHIENERERERIVERKYSLRRDSSVCSWANSNKVYSIASCMNNIASSL